MTEPSRRANAPDQRARLYREAGSRSPRLHRPLQQLRIAEDLQAIGGAPSARVASGVIDVMVSRKANHAFFCGKADAAGSAILDGRVDNPHSNVPGMVPGIG